MVTSYKVVVIFLPSEWCLWQYGKEVEKTKNFHFSCMFTSAPHAIQRSYSSLQFSMQVLALGSHARFKHVSNKSDTAYQSYKMYKTYKTREKKDLFFFL